jgi:hypothetical protein
MKMAIFWVVTATIIRAIALMMEAASTSETSVNFYQTTRRNNPEDSHLLGLYILSVYVILLVRECLGPKKDEVTGGWCSSVVVSCLVHMSRSSSVSVVSDYKRGSIPGRGKGFFF